MPWVNVFDVGPCSVEVYRYGNYVPPEDYASRDLEVTVTGGIVTVVQVSESDTAYMDGYTVTVRPEYAVGNQSVRVLGVETSAAGDYPADYAFASGTSEGDNPSDGPEWSHSLAEVELGGGLSAYTPDPAEFFGFSDNAWSNAGVRMRAGE